MKTINDLLEYIINEKSEIGYRFTMFDGVLFNPIAKGNVENPRKFKVPKLATITDFLFKTDEGDSYFLEGFEIHKDVTETYIDVVSLFESKRNKYSKRNENDR